MRQVDFLCSYSSLDDGVAGGACRIQGAHGIANHEHR